MASQARQGLSFDPKAREQWSRLKPGDWWIQRSHRTNRVRIIERRGLTIRFHCRKTRRAPTGENAMSLRAFLATFIPDGPDGRLSGRSDFPIIRIPDAAAQPIEFLICECRENRIPAPSGATSETRYTCRHCMAQLARKANIEEAHRLRSWLTFAERMEETGAEAI